MDSFLQQIPIMLWIQGALSIQDVASLVFTIINFDYFMHTLDLDEL